MGCEMFTFLESPLLPAQAMSNPFSDLFTSGSMLYDSSHTPTHTRFPPSADRGTAAVPLLVLAKLTDTLRSADKL